MNCQCECGCEVIVLKTICFLCLDFTHRKKWHWGGG